MHTIANITVWSNMTGNMVAEMPWNVETDIYKVQSRNVLLVGVGPKTPEQNLVARTKQNGGRAVTNITILGIKDSDKESILQESFLGTSTTMQTYVKRRPFRSRSFGFHNCVAVASIQDPNSLQTIEIDVTSFQVPGLLGTLVEVVRSKLMHDDNETTYTPDDAVPLS